MMNLERNGMMAAVVAVVLAACGGAGEGGMIAARSTSGRVGPAGGRIETEHGVAVAIPAGALRAETEIRVNEPARRESEPRRIEIEPRGLPLGAPMSVRVKAEDGYAGDERLVEIERRGELEIEHGIETERHDEVEHAREVEVEHLPELELRHARTCDVACGAGLECDDGFCKPHGGTQ